MMEECRTGEIKGKIETPNSRRRQWFVVVVVGGGGQWGHCL